LTHERLTKGDGHCCTWATKSLVATNNPHAFLARQHHRCRSIGCTCISPGPCRWSLSVRSSSQPQGLVRLSRQDRSCLPVRTPYTSFQWLTFPDGNPLHTIHILMMLRATNLTEMDMLYILCFRSQLHSGRSCKQRMLWTSPETSALQHMMNKTTPHHHSKTCPHCSSCSW
jgi:hypothetical protein